MNPKPYFTFYSYFYNYLTFETVSLITLQPNSLTERTIHWFSRNYVLTLNINIFAILLSLYYWKWWEPTFLAGVKKDDYGPFTKQLKQEIAT